MAVYNLSTVSKILILQVLVIATVSVFFVLFKGLSGGVSPLLGGGAAFIPNLYMALNIYRAEGQDAKKVINSFYRGESGKLVLTGLLFYWIFQLPNIEILPLLVGYIAALSVFWFALILR